VTTIVKAISASPAMMTKPRRDDRRESAPSQRSSKGKSENNILPVSCSICAPIFMGHNRKRR
jgi:hypothetical protein